MSPRTGRPKSDDPKTLRFSVCLNKSESIALQNYCNKNHITKGEAIRQGLYLLLGITQK